MANTRENVQCRHIVITNNSCNESTNVTQEITNVVDVNTIGPQGRVGPIGLTGPTGSISAHENLSVTGSLFISGTSGNISASGGIQVGAGTFVGSEEAAKTDAALVIPQNTKIYTLDNNGGNLRNLISKGTDKVIDIGQNTIFINEIRLSPGTNGFTSFYSGSTGTEVARIDAGGNITASGDISASRFIAPTGLGTDNTHGYQFNHNGDLNANRISVTTAQNMQFRAGGVFQFANGHMQILAGNELQFNTGDNKSRFKILNTSATTGSGGPSPDNIELAIKNMSDTTLLNLSGSGDITFVGDVSGSGTGSFEYLKLDYNSMSDVDPNIKGVVYRNGSNQLFISAG
jgi:Fe-S cluster assembly iron-binding protein IscA